MNMTQKGSLDKLFSMPRPSDFGDDLSERLRFWEACAEVREAFASDPRICFRCREPVASTTLNPVDDRTIEKLVKKSA